MGDSNWGQRLEKNTGVSDKGVTKIVTSNKPEFGTKLVLEQLMTQKLEGTRFEVAEKKSKYR